MVIALPHSKEAYRLMHEGAVALSKVEHAGMRIDERYLHHTVEQIDRDKEAKLRRLRDSKFGRRWRKRFGSKTNYESDQQLGTVLFDVLKLKDHGKTEGDQWKVDQSTLVKVDHPAVKKILEIRKMGKSRDFLLSIARETVGGFVHPSFNLHIPRTFRSSCNDPNFQNLPKRDKAMRDLVRRAILARRGHRLVEIDYSGAEVLTACCYHKDPAMKAYLLGHGDMHRDMAMRCYRLPESEITKPIRHAAKNKFVFPQFYGDWWMSCAKNLWEAIQIDGLVTTSGVPLRQHLKSIGITKLGAQDRSTSNPMPGSFEDHICDVESYFWGKKFKQYAMWKKRWYEDYLRRGWFQMLTGFVCSGYMNRKEVINYPVQGAAFHLLLWSLIRLVNVELRRAGMKAQIVGQIHDSIIADVPEEEVYDFISLARYVMVDLVMEHFDWLIIPVSIEVEMTPVGGSWVELEGCKQIDGFRKEGHRIHSVRRAA